MACRFETNDSGEITGAFTQSGERSKLFDDLYTQFGKQDGVMYFAISESDDFKEIFPQETTIENLLRYVANQNKTEEKITKEQLVDLQDFSNFDREKLFDTFYDKNGLFLVVEDKLTKSGLYSAYEAGTIANDAELQDRIKDALERLKNTSDEELQLVEPGQVTKLNEFNSFGKLATIDAVSDATNEGVNQNNEGIKQAEVFVEVDGQIRPKRNTETELILPITAKQTTNSKVSDLNTISLEVLQNNEQETRQVLDEIENELIEDSIDVIGLTEKPIDENLKDFLVVLDRFIKVPTKENTKDFADKADEYFNRDLSPKKENIDGEQNKEYVKLETTLSEEEAYNQQGLIKLDENTYIKTAKEDLTTLYENLRTYTEKYSGTLEEHVQEQLKNYNYTNAEIVEAIILYKMYFGIEGNTEIKDTEWGKMGWMDKQQSVVNELPKIKVFYQDIKRAGFLPGVFNNPQALDSSVFKSAKSIYEGLTKGEIVRNTPYVNEDMQLMDGINRVSAQVAAGIEYIEVAVISDSFYDYLGKRITELDKKYKSSFNVKQVSNFTGNYNYLTEEFPSDFYSKFLAEKKKNSKLFRNFYSNFEINEKGINLINKSETALRNIKIYADENLKQYSLISKQLPDMVESNDAITNPRVEAINNPQKVKESKENLYKLNDQEIILKNETEDFVRIGSDIYESVAKQGNLNHLVKLENNNSDYYTVEVKAPQTNLKISDYNYLNESPENFKSIKKAETPEELNC